MVTFINLVALRKAKTPQSFGHSECNRFKICSLPFSSCYNGSIAKFRVHLFCMLPTVIQTFMNVSKLHFIFPFFRHIIKHFKCICCLSQHLCSSRQGLKKFLMFSLFPYGRIDGISLIYKRSSKNFHSSYSMRHMSWQVNK